MSTRGEKLLSIRKLRVAATNGDSELVEILNGIDLDLHRGEVLGLVGESGAGKSMLGLAAMGYARVGCRIVGGEIKFKGISLTDATDEEKRSVRGLQVAYVAQSASASFNPARRLIYQFAENPVHRAHRSRPEVYADARQLYAQMQLPNPDVIGFRYPHQLSGGQLQRAMVATAMSCRPDLIVLDEPTTSLDVTTQIGVLAAIKKVIQQHDIAAIYISHDLAVVAQMAQRIMVLRHGRVVEEGDAQSIMANPREGYTKSLWAVRLLKKEASSPIIGQPVISVRALEAGYARGPLVVRDVSFDVQPKRTVAVVGESGSGKSTLARVLAGLLKPKAGELLFLGKPLPQNVADRSKDEQRRVQIIYQSADTALNPRHTIRGILGRPIEFYFGGTSQTIEHRVRELLAQVELPFDVISRYPGELSGGQRQRIGIARALAAKPDVIICDEVTSGLDQLVAERILKLLLKQQQVTGVSYIFITHDLATVEAIADDVVVMNKGQIVDYGSKAEVMSPPRHNYTKLLLSSVPRMDAGWLDRHLQSRDGAHSS